MTWQEWLGLIVLVLIALAALAVVRCREPIEQAVALSLYGLLLALMFAVYQAPDVALSQLVVGTVALPLVVVLALGEIRHEQQRREREARGSREEQ